MSPFLFLLLRPPWSRTQSTGAARRSSSPRAGRPRSGPRACLPSSPSRGVSPSRGLFSFSFSPAFSLSLSPSYLARGRAQPCDQGRRGGQQQPVSGLRARARAQRRAQRVRRKACRASGRSARDALGTRLRALGEERRVDDDAGDCGPLAGRGDLVRELDGDSWCAVLLSLVLWV